tara:strand:- start:431 stop:910 length:480 start_codon:yes stop_codon:yes gene_type:complete
MWETLVTVGSGGLGGLLRLAPEIMKGFDRKHERQHELAMMQVEIQIVEKRMEHEMRKVDAAMTMTELDAISAAVKEQGQTARAAGKFVAAISALVRPLVTYWFVIMYSAVKIVGMAMAVQAGGDWKEVLVSSWTGDDMAMLVMILSFWFVGRVYEKQRS